MHLIKETLNFQIQKIRTNFFTFLLIAATAFITIYIGYIHHTIKQSVAYLAAMWLCSFFIDLFVIIKPATNDFVVRHPKRETILFFICFLLGTTFLFIRFSGIVDWDHINRFVEIAVIPLILFVYPIALASIMFLLKYKPLDLGLRFQGLITTVPVIVISIIVNRLVCPTSLTWNTIFTESGGIIGTLYTGFILAGLSEEFFRVIGQTRFGALINNKGIAWFTITVLWACMHIPKWYNDQHNIAEAVLGAVRIIPIGLMWGYITHRTKSFIPAVIVHGTNFWGLQNF